MTETLDLSKLPEQLKATQERMAHEMARCHQGQGWRVMFSWRDTATTKIMQLESDVASLQRQINILSSWIKATEALSTSTSSGNTKASRSQKEKP